jgi:hypothetical protein
MRWDYARIAWQDAAQNVATQVSGEVRVVHSWRGVFLNSIWAEYEYPLLRDNPKVQRIIGYVLSRDGTLQQVRDE